MASWCPMISFSVMLSSKSSTSRNSRSIRPISRLPNTPVHTAQCTFLSDESFRYYRWFIYESRRSTSARWEAYLAGDDKCAQEYAFVGPLFEGNVEMGFCPVQVDKGGQDDGNFNFSPGEDIVDHNIEGRALGVPRKRSAPGGL